MEDPAASHQALCQSALCAKAKVGGVVLGIYDRPTSLLGIRRGTAGRQRRRHNYHNGQAAARLMTLS